MFFVHQENSAGYTIFIINLTVYTFLTDIKMQNLLLRFLNTKEPTGKILFGLEQVAP